MQSGSPVGIGNLQQALGARQLGLHISKLALDCRHLVALQLHSHVCGGCKAGSRRVQARCMQASLTAATLSLSSCTATSTT